MFVSCSSLTKYSSEEESDEDTRTKKKDSRRATMAAVMLPPAAKAAKKNTRATPQKDEVPVAPLITNTSVTTGMSPLYYKIGLEGSNTYIFVIKHLEIYNNTIVYNANSYFQKRNRGERLVSSNLSCRKIWKLVQIRNLK